MDKLMNYQNIIIGYLQERAKSIPANLSGIESQVIVDRENNHFQLLQLGWHDGRFHFTVVFHFDIYEGKIWFQRNITEHEVIDVLIERGVEKQDIILGFKPIYARQMSDADILEA